MRLDKSQIAEIKQLKSKGFPDMKIALQLGISYWTVRYHINENYREAIKRNNKKRWEDLRKK